MPSGEEENEDDDDQASSASSDSMQSKVQHVSLGARVAESKAIQEQVQIIETSMIDKEAEAANLLEQLTTLLENVQSLEEDVQYFENQGDQLKDVVPRVQRRNEQLEQHLQSVQTAIAKRNTDVHERLPQMVCVVL